MRNILVILALMMVLTGCGDKQASAPAGDGSQPKAAKATATADNPKIALGMDYLKQGDVRQAIQSFDDAIRENPKDVQGYMILGQTYMHLGEYNRAIDTFTVAAKIEPANGQAHYLLATNFGLAGNFDQARVQAQKCIEIFRQNQDEDNFKRSVALLQGLPAPTVK